MKALIPIIQVIVAFGLLNVWLVRFHQSTLYRGGGSHSMREEFAYYGFSVWFTYVIGALKVGAALCLIAGLWLHILVFPAAFLICILMLGALTMHFKVRDPLKKFLPALIMLILSISVCFGSFS
ncbi:DoxX family protein [Tunturiibacter lichenicola]|jgi:DoxX-like family|uniref:DoxX family protein n=1 Tax=Tunturiibacter lichenicola TaxID=2051959 RepID=UPI003D9B3874